MCVSLFKRDAISMRLSSAMISILLNSFWVFPSSCKNKKIHQKFTLIGCYMIISNKLCAHGFLHQSKPYITTNQCEYSIKFLNDLFIARQNIFIRFLNTFYDSPMEKCCQFHFRTVLRLKISPDPTPLTLYSVLAGLICPMTFPLLKSSSMVDDVTYKSSPPLEFFPPNVTEFIPFPNSTTLLAVLDLRKIDNEK